MRARISPSVKNILVPLRYNEQKIVNEKAERIRAENFLKNYDQLTKPEIIERFRGRTSLNEPHHDHGIHFTLNFGKENLTNQRMSELTGRYMSGMGLEDQPYVAYRHNDAGHYHLHVVATAIRSDGSFIDLGPKDIHQSHNICQALEKEFLLASAPSQQTDFAVDHAQRIVYGERPLMRSVSDVLNTVVDHYNYTSLDEFNAVLKQYNVEANPGTPGSRLRQTGGLLYHTLDDQGNHIGVPIKASRFLLKPTLKNLEQKFERNEALREGARERMTGAIEWALAGTTPHWAKFTSNLEKDGISTLVAKDEGRVFFVDHGGRASFEGKNLGEGYNLTALRGRCALDEPLTEELLQKQQLRLHL